MNKKEELSYQINAAEKILKDLKAELARTVMHEKFNMTVTIFGSKSIKSVLNQGDNNPIVLTIAGERIIEGVNWVVSIKEM